MANNKKQNVKNRKQPPQRRQTPKAEPYDRFSDEDVSRISQVAAFAVSLIFFFLAVIKGEGVWNVLHNVYVGIFGILCAVLLPVISIAVTIFVAVKKSTSANFVAKTVEGFVFVLLIGAFVHIVMNNSGEVFIDTVKNSYLDAPYSFNGGFFGALFGWLMLTCGKTPAIIIDLVLVFVDFMLLTGFTIIQFFKGMGTPAKKAVETVAPVIEEKIEQRRRNKFNIDVALDDEPPLNAENKESASNDSGSVPKDIIDEINSITAKNKAQRKVPKEKTIDEIVEKASESEEKPKIEELKVSKEAMESTVADYVFPPVSILKTAKAVNSGNVNEELKQNANRLIETLRSFNVDATITDIFRGPTVTRYELKPAAGIRISKITNLADDIALNLAATHVRIEAPIPGKAAVGIEVPNKVKSSVSMRELIDTVEFEKASSKLTAGLGKDISGEGVYADMAKMPHLLIAGTTGAGKSVCMNSIIVSILYKAKPDEVKFLMIDPKQVEFSKYKGIPHLLVDVVTDPRKAAGALGWAVSEMLQRYQKFSETGVRDIEGYNKFVKKHDDMAPMPKIVIFIDELADLMMAAPKEVEDSICRLAQMARAAGMHLIIATQRPSVDVITGLIKANISSRIALTVSSQIDSRTILDSAGAEKLLGRGDMLFNPVGASKPRRVQGCFISDEEVEELCEFIKRQGPSEYSDEIQKEIEEKAVQDKKASSPFEDVDGEEKVDALFEQAVEVVLENSQASTSFLQRKLSVGYARGAKIMDQLQEKGIIGPPEGSKPRKILITPQQWTQMKAYSDNVDFTAENTEQMAFFDDDISSEDDGEF